MYVEADSLSIVQVNPNVTRKMAHLDDLIVTLIEFSNGPMAEPDPFHSHPHEQMTYSNTLKLVDSFSPTEEDFFTTVILSF